MSKMEPNTMILNDNDLDNFVMTPRRTSVKVTLVGKYGTVKRFDAAAVGLYVDMDGERHVNVVVFDDPDERDASHE